MVSVYAPTTAAEAGAVMRAAGLDGLTVLPTGAGTKAYWGGTPSRVDIAMDCRRLHGVTAHEPGDLVATVRAGTALRDVQAVLALAGQRLAVEAGSPEATIGGVLAAGEAGPLRLRYGAGRDVLIGVEFVRADGVLAHSGGRVVKNVAGYDLGRLLCGSYGTLGLITSATFRLHPLPARRAWVLREFGGAAALAGMVGLVDAVMSPHVSPAAVELDLRRGAGTLVALIEGSKEGVAARTAAAIARWGGPAESVGEPEWWGRYPFAAGDIALKIAVPVARLGGLLERLCAMVPDVAVRGSAGAGVVYARLKAAMTAGELGEVLRTVRDGLRDGSGSVVVLAAPAPTRDEVDLWGPVSGLSLMRRVKAQFDPDNRLVAGRFVGGI